MPDGESHSTTDPIESEIQKFVTYKSWRKYVACLRGYMRRLRQSADREP